MGTARSREQAASSSSPAVPTTSTDGPATVPGAPSTSTSDNKQPESKRELHKFEEIVAGESATEDQVSTGIFLANKTKKYWVDKNNNCFMLFPRGLSIAWKENPSYWTWQPLVEGSDDVAGIEVAELKNVCWLEISGKQELSHLTPGVTYEVVYEVMLKQKSYGWREKVDLRLKFPDGSIKEHKEDLNDKTREMWLQLKVDDVEEHNKMNGEFMFCLFEYGGHWKSGLVVKGIKITPKE